MRFRGEAWRAPRRSPSLPLLFLSCACSLCPPQEMKRRGRSCRFGVVSMCIGSGMGAAAVFEQGGEVDCMATRAVKAQNLLSKDAVIS
jgi:acetyl-CoA acyltransferase 1